MSLPAIGTLPMIRKTTPLRQRQHAATAEAMLDAAERAMIRHGYERATMQQIARQTGCAAGTFYLYFRNKQVLFEAILLRHVQAMLQAGRSEMAQADGPLEKVRRSVAAMLGYWRGRDDSLRLVFTAWPVRSSEMHQRLTEMGWKEHLVFRRTLVGHLRDAQKRGLARRDLPAEALMDFIDAVAFSLVEAFSFSPRKVAFEEQMRAIWGLITGGLLHRGAP